MFRRALLILALAVSVAPLVALAADENDIVIVVPADQTREATSADGAIVTFTATAHKKEDELAVTCLPPSGSTFPIEETTVDCSATDGNETAHETFKITVRDTTAPAVTVPANMTAEATDWEGEIVTFSASASDLVDGSLPVECTHASGTRFPLGTTWVTCRAMDTRDNEGTATFAITVYEGDPPPVLTVPADMIVEAQSVAGATVTYTASAIDWRSRALAVACSPSSATVLGLGVTNVICTAEDAYKRPSTRGFKVTVVDTQPPIITTSGSRLVSTKSRAGAVVNYAVSAADVADGPLAVNCAPASGTRFPVGITEVSCTAADRQSNTASEAFEVTVVLTPARKARKTAVLSPAAGARLTAPPMLRWRSASKARFYNVQLFRKGQKVLSAWPTRPILRLHSKWTFKGRSYRLRPGSYTWLVWPGYGQAAQPRFGKLLLLSRFVVARR